MRQSEVSACRSSLGLTLRGASPCFSSEIRRVLKALILRLNRFQTDTHPTEDTRMDRDILQSELTCQLVRGISGYNGEYDT